MAKNPTMTVVQHLISPATLPSAVLPLSETSSTSPSPSCFAEQLSVLSYNILLPNSVDGWWTYKMYMPPLPKELQYQSSWEYRKDLLRKRIELMNPDVVCLQEVSPKSFEQDFDFMASLGYDGSELFNRGRFRPATFWKTSECQLVEPGGTAHKDRTLLTAFSLNEHRRKKAENLPEQPSSEGDRHWYILNCHLQAGKNGPRRVRQIHEGVRSVLTMARKLNEPNPEAKVRLVVCGDFNGGPECGAVRLLEDGSVDHTFLEDGEPVSSKKKAIPLTKPMVDVVTTVDRSNNQPPPTLVVSELITSMIEEGTEDDPVYCQDMIDRLRRVYARLAGHENRNNNAGSGKVMTLQQVQQWLITINGELGRGDEYREAAKQMGWTNPNPDEKLSKEEEKALIQLPSDGVLSFEGFVAVYQKELQAGKFWGVAHDMAVLGDPLPNVGNFEARYDRMYYTSTSLKPVAVVDTTCSQPCPNANEPSDHLPVAACFKEVLQT